MPVNRKIYNQVGMFVGPCPSSGYHFLSDGGVPTFDDDIDASLNLVFPLNRVISAGYGFSEPRTDVRSLGYNGTLARPALLPPNIELQFSYYQMGLINEARLGFVFNRPSGDLSTNPSIYGTGRVLPISGFLDRKYESTIESEYGWPLTTRDSRNIFIATKDNGEDLNDTVEENGYKSNGLNVLAFGDCFISNYNVSASVGAIPQASVTYSCNNIQYYNYASGKNIPSVNPRTYTLNSGIYYNLPKNFQGIISDTGITSVLLPKDISVTINHYDGSPIVNFPVDINDIKIQSYQIDLSLERESINKLGYKLPLDKMVNLPAYANLDISALVGDNQTGSLVDFFREDKEYNVTIKMNYSPRKQFSGVAIQYDFIGAKFNNISIQDGIGVNRSANLSFTSEMNPERMDKGFFISGQLGLITNIPRGTIFLGDDFDGMGGLDLFLTQDGDSVILSQIDRLLMF